MKKLLLVFILLSLTCGLSAYWFYNLLNAPLSLSLNDTEDSQTFEVKQGATLNRVLSSLVENGIVDSPLWVYKVYARLTDGAGLD